MQDYIDLARKNGIILENEGVCQFCGAATTRSVHECLEVFNLIFQNIDFSKSENHIYRFLTVDAHTLQHPEIHGRWNNHFHLTRLHLIFEYKVKWTYQLSPLLSDQLNKYKRLHPEEYLTPPPVLKRGKLTSVDITCQSQHPEKLQSLIRDWALEVYSVWKEFHSIVDEVAQQFLKNRY